LKDAAEEAKIQLSSSSQADVNLLHIQGARALRCRITRAILEDLTRLLLDRTTRLTQCALRDAKVPAEGITDIVLVGSSTRMPIIRSQLKTQFPHATFHPIRPENAVAIGCAVQGAIIDNKITDLVALDVTTSSLGIELVGGLFEKVVGRNTPIPTQKTACFTTTADYVTELPICFYQGESDLVFDNTYLGSTVMRNIQCAEKGVPNVEITFDIDSDGIVKASAKDLSTRSKVSYLLNRNLCITATAMPSSLPPETENSISSNTQASSLPAFEKQGQQR
jgi:molecular chaperone DnaK